LLGNDRNKQTRNNGTAVESGILCVVRAEIIYQEPAAVRTESRDASGKSRGWCGMAAILGVSQQIEVS
jgi:hypothetical protein